jgi:hypothetical protein
MLIKIAYDLKISDKIWKLLQFLNGGLHFMQPANNINYKRVKRWAKG